MGKSSGNVPPSGPSPRVDFLETVEIAAGVFKNVCLALMDDVRDNRRQYVITKHGQPVARLVPPDYEPPNGFGFLRGTVLEELDIVTPDFEEWGEHSP